MSESTRKNLVTVDGDTLMLQEFEPLQFSVEKILPHGLFIMAGSGKIGKSWLALNIATAVSTGGNIWGFPAKQGEVLYFALEDNYRRIQDRLKIMKIENMNISRLHIATASFGITSGLMEQTKNFLESHPYINLIIIDTLERIRDTNYDKNMYSCDYRDMTTLREITNNHKLTLLLIHHTRKMYDPDPLNTLSGSTGLIGAVDGVFVLEKETRTGDKAKLTIANRDTEGFCLKLRFDCESCRWNQINNGIDDDDDEKGLCVLINNFLCDEWKGTTSELGEELKRFAGASFEYNPASLAKSLRALTDLLKTKYNIIINFERNMHNRRIFLSRG